ncbi:MAG: T9SS type A sorting domain-containing protein [Bacteroidales bacterium]|nr:T9SS type A sorting domain-containing protein [Bacteroidales bacterium]
MKTFTLLLFGMMSVLVASAQITVTNDALAPAGTHILMAYDTINASLVSPGAAGADKTWDFSALAVTDMDTVSLLLPGNTPYGNNFPMSNFAVGIVSSDSYAYFTRNSSIFSNLGVAATIEPYGFISTSIVPPNIYLDFPVNYGNIRIEQYSMEVKLADNSLPGVDSIKYKSTTNEILTVDAWGSITIPIGTFEALRQKEEKTISDSIWMRFFGNWILLSTSVELVDTYNWWTNNMEAGFTLCSIDVDPSNQDVTNISFLNSTIVGVNEIAEEQIHCYPNPAVNQATITFPPSQTLKSIDLYTITGSLVRVDTHIEAGRVILEVDELPEGVYVAQMLFANGQSFTTKVVKN